VRIAVYSALYGGYEQPKPLPKVLPCFGYLFTDDPDLEAPGWHVIYEPKPVTIPELDTPMMQAKWWKTHPREALGYTADVAVWIDASVTVEPWFITTCLTALRDDDWAMVKHPGRDCIYDEAAYSKTLPRYGGAKLDEQTAYYREIGHPEHWGLFANGVSVRRLTPAVLDVSRQWWWECATRSWQDQVSLPVLVRLAGDGLKWNTDLGWCDGWVVADHPPG
jgi:hypothetical protein